MSKYVDIPAIVQVIGNIYNNVELLDDEAYKFNEGDFPEELHKIVFGTMYNLHLMGAKEITPIAIEDYLDSRPKKLQIYKNAGGASYLQSVAEAAERSTFDYYYKRMKKMTLLRMYHEVCFMDLSWLYDVDNLFDLTKKQKQEDWLDNTSLEAIAQIIDDKISDIRMNFVDQNDAEAQDAGDGILELLDRLKKEPEVGVPLYGKLINGVTRGARLKKFYLRSAATGLGKTRMMIADACYIGCNEIYNKKYGRWVKNGTAEPTLFIATEQDLEEVQTMMLAFLSGVNEDHILENRYEDGEWERVVYAAHLIKRCPLKVKHMPDFNLLDIENTIKKAIKDYGMRYCMFDYIHSSMTILSEISGKAGVKGLREDNVLFMLASRLKDLCNIYGIFIMSATQLNGDYRNAKIFDQNLLRGAKSIADRIDAGMILAPVSEEDLESLRPLLEKGQFETPNAKMSVYKNRRGRHKDIFLWCKKDLGTCRIDPMFSTEWNYEYHEIKDIYVEVVEREDENKQGRVEEQSIA